MISDDIQQKREYVIINIVERFNREKENLGKKKLQKIIYFLQALGVDLKYKYEIYHYGPYCFDLSHDIDSLDASCIIDVSPDESGFGYEISINENFNRDDYYDKRVINQFNENINSVLENICDKFYDKKGWEAELAATIHFVKKIMKKHNPNTQPEEVYEKVKELKPKYEIDDIQRYDNELLTKIIC